MSLHGKSNFANELAYEHDRAVIADPMKEFDGKYFYSVKGIERHITGNPLYRVMTNNVQDFDRLCALVTRLARPDARIALVLDEVTRFEFDVKLKKFPHFRNIIFGGGHDGIDMIAVTQRFSDFPKALRASAWTRIVCFNQADEDDLRKLKRITSRETAAEISKLQKRNFISITNQQVERGHT